MYDIYKMMIKPDACSLIYAIKLGIIENIQHNFQDVIISPGVKEEVIDRGKKKGHPDAFVAEQLLNQKKLEVHAPKDPLVLPNLGKGEVETITLAQEEKCTCIIDDTRAQKVGINLGVELTSIPLIMLTCLKQGGLSPEVYAEKIEKYARMMNISQTELWYLKKLGELFR